MYYVLSNLSCVSDQWQIQDFLVGGASLVRGVSTPNAATFRKICMSKLNNQDPGRGGSTPDVPPLESATDVVQKALSCSITTFEKKIYYLFLRITLQSFKL